MTRFEPMLAQNTTTWSPRKLKLTTRKIFTSTALRRVNKFPIMAVLKSNLSNVNPRTEKYSPIFSFLRRFFYLSWSMPVPAYYLSTVSPCSNTRIFLIRFNMEVPCQSELQAGISYQNLFEY